MSNTQVGIWGDNRRAIATEPCATPWPYTRRRVVQGAPRASATSLRQRSVIGGLLWDIAHVGFLEETSAIGVRYFVRRVPDFL